MTALIWTEERKERLGSFLEGHRLAMLHCDMEIRHNGRCECMERLAQHWADREAAIVGLRSEVKELRS